LGLRVLHLSRVLYGTDELKVSYKLREKRRSGERERERERERRRRRRRDQHARLEQDRERGGAATGFGISNFIGEVRRNTKEREKDAQEERSRVAGDFNF
jgi:hypothetical protein